eukprot:1468406-Prorocentrum_lima.AAC.1
MAGGPTVDPRRRQKSRYPAPPSQKDGRLCSCRRHEEYGEHSSRRQQCVTQLPEARAEHRAAAH